ncbi:MAG: hypothetical protein JST83_19020 [Bacteroidetes bacterium]|nr:hypothetical protein [Bacteroidota bacterium]
MKTITCLVGTLVLAGWTMTAGAQKNVNITLGPDFELPKKSVDVDFIGRPTVGYLEFSHQRGKAIYLQKFSPALSLTGTTTVPVTDLPKGYVIDDIAEIDSKNYMLYSTYGKTDPVERLYAQQVDVAKGAYEGAPAELLVASDKLAGTLEMSGTIYVTSEKYKFAYSADKSRMLVQYRLEPHERDRTINKDIIGFSVYDKTLKKLWGREVEMPYTQAAMDYKSYQVDSKGNVYILAKIFRVDDKGRQMWNDYHHEVLMYEKDAKKPIIASFKFDDKYVLDAALAEDKNNRMVCAGFYSKARQGTAGVFFLSFDEASNSVKNIKKGLYEFPADLIRSFESPTTQRKADKKTAEGEGLEIPHLNFRNLTVADDGSLTIFGEQFDWIDARTSNGNSRCEYFFDDIYVMRANADGEMQWVRKIPKAQTESTEGGFHPDRSGMGFHLHVSGDDCFLIFPDNMKNLNIGPDQAPAKYVAGHGGALMSVRIAGDGSITKSAIYDFRDENVGLMVQQFSSISATEIIGRVSNLVGPFRWDFQNGKLLLLTLK